jgi:hypothetical protein
VNALCSHEGSVSKDQPCPECAGADHSIGVDTDPASEDFHCYCFFVDETSNATTAI